MAEDKSDVQKPSEELAELQKENEALSAKVADLEEELSKKESYIKGLNTKLKKASGAKDEKPKGFIEH